jgi:hypothetical protein
MVTLCKPSARRAGGAKATGLPSENLAREFGYPGHLARSANPVTGLNRALPSSRLTDSRARPAGSLPNLTRSHVYTRNFC